MRMICKIFFALVFLIQVFSCARLDNTGSNQKNFPPEAVNAAPERKEGVTEFELNRLKWLKTSITAYEMTIRYSNGGMNMIASPVVIMVDKGVARSIKPVHKDGGTIERYNAFDTVEKLFKAIENAPTGKDSRVRVEYDSGYGYPKKISIDPSTTAEDDGFDIEIMNFKVIRPT